MEFLKFILMNTNPGIAAAIALLFGLLLVLSVTGAVRETDEKTALELGLIWLRRALVILLLTCVPLLAAGLYLLAFVSFDYSWEAANRYMSLWFAELKSAASGMWWSLLVVLLTPILMRTLVLRWFRPALSSWARKFRIKQSGDSLSDIRIEVSKIKPKDFNPQTFYKPGSMFVGLDEKKQPAYIEDQVFRKNHLKVIGPSQTGKGVNLGVMLDQAIIKGWGVWFVDMKPDDFIYDIMRESCARNRRNEPTIVDLNGNGPGAYAPFANGTMRERRERVVKAFSIADSGQTADFYKRNEREVLDFLMPFWDGSLGGLKKLLKGKHPEISDSKRQWIQGNCGSLQSNVSEFSQLETLCATKEQSFNVANALENGSVVYIRSHMKDTIVRKGTIALLDEVVQIALRKPVPVPVFMVIDECRFVVSDTLADALATVLSKGINIALAYQSVMDLLNLPDKSLNAQSIKVGVETNTQITLSYRANDHETAEWVSLQTGTAQKNVTKFEKVDVNRGGAEEWASERSVGQVEEQLVTANQLLALPPRVGALIRPNTLASLVYTCWVPVKELKGMPSRTGAAKVSAPTVEKPSTVALPSPVEPAQDPYSLGVDDSYSDPFAAQSEAFADPFSGSIKGESNQSASDSIKDPDKAPQDSIKKRQKAKLSEEEEAAISAALHGIISHDAEPKTRAKATPEKSAQNSSSIDLSDLDDIEGI